MVYLLKGNRIRERKRMKGKGIKIRNSIEVFTNYKGNGMKCILSLMYIIFTISLEIKLKIKNSYLNGIENE